MQLASSRGCKKAESISWGPSPALCLNLRMFDWMRAAMTPRWSRAIVLAALFSVWLLVLTSSKDDTYEGNILTYRNTHSTSVEGTHHEFAYNAQQQTRRRPFRPKQNNKQVRYQIIENCPIFSFVRVFRCLALPRSRTKDLRCQPTRPLVQLTSGSKTRR